MIAPASGGGLRLAALTNSAYRRWRAPDRVRARRGMRRVADRRSRLAGPARGHPGRAGHPLTLIIAIPNDELFAAARRSSPDRS